MELTGIPRTPDGPIRAVLFDVDGTLIATRRLYVEAFADALEPVVGARLSESEIMARHPRAERRFLREFAGPATPETLEVFYRSFEAGHDRYFEGIYTGVPTLLQELRGRRVPLGLVTGKSRRAWEITAPRTLLGDFDVVVLDDDVPAPKPDPAGLRLALEALGEDPARVVYVGDSLTDLEAARAAGVTGAAVLWSKKSEEVERFRADSLALGACLLPDPAGVLELLEG